MKKVYRGALCACLAGFVLASCEPVDPYTGNEGESGGSDSIVVKLDGSPDSTIVQTKDSLSKVFILCEGLYQANNADLSMYLPGSLSCTPEYYLEQNGQYLGDTGQDILYHQDYLYVSVYGSSYVAKLDIEGKEVARRSFSAEDGQPRYLTADGDYIYVTLYSGKVAKMKASDLSIVDYAPVGMNPEDIILYKGQLLVANSGWGYDNRVTVIDVATFDSISSITVEWNPQQFVVAGDSVYLLANGQYDENWNCDYPVQHIDVATGEVRTITHAARAVAHDGTLYLCSSVTDWATYETVNTYFSYDVATATVNNDSFLQGDTEELTSNSVYMMEVDPKNGDFYIGLAGNKFVSSGMIHRCDKDGHLIHRFDVGGANPNQAAFVGYE